MLLSIGELSAAVGVSIATLRRWDRAGQLHPTCRTCGNHRRYDLPTVLRQLGANDAGGTTASADRLAVGYARVSSHDQKDDLERQKERLAGYLDGEKDSLLIADLGSGLNFKKRGLAKLLALILAGRVARLYLTHKDRLLRFGYELVEQLVNAHGGEVILLEDVRGQEDAELAKDVLTIITVFSAKLYGRRAHQHRRAEAAVA